jgi:subtilisin family serine protease
MFPNQQGQQAMGFTISEFPKTLKFNNDTRLILDRARLLLGLSTPVERKDLYKYLRHTELYLEDAIDEVGGRAAQLRERVNHTETLLWVRTKELRAIRPKVMNLLPKELLEMVKWTAPVYQLTKTKGPRLSSASKSRTGRLALIPTMLIVKGKGDNIDGNRLMRALGGYNLKVQRSKRLAGYLYCTRTPSTQENVWDIQKQLLKKEHSSIDHVLFDFIPMFIPTGLDPGNMYYEPDLPEYNGQWNMWRIQAGADPQDSTPSTTGWDTTTGNSNVVVAVIDEGCDLTHPDLVNSWVGQGATFDWDHELEQPEFLPGGGQEGSFHGTWCAEIIGARHGAAGGVAGLAPDCKILPIKIRSWRQSVVAEAIKYAADQGVDVISMSFGGDASKGDYLNNDIVRTAIEAAYSGNNAAQRRVLLCAATMNDNQNLIYYPAAHPQVMAVGASNMNDTRCNEDNWGLLRGSNFGAALSVVAPGIEIPTTSDQSRARFFGTSAATPHVAGLAALLISKFSQLKNNPGEVRRIIEQSANKVGASYGPGKPNGDWDEEMGYGRINVLQALQQATSEGLH